MKTKTTLKIIALNFAIAVIISATLQSYAQTAINSTGNQADASAILDVSSSAKGMLIPRVALTSTTDASTITSPATSLIVYNTASTGDVTPGFYYWSSDATKWIKIISAAGGGWLSSGNTGTDSTVNFIGTTDAQALTFKTSNSERMRINKIGNIGIGTTTPSSKLDIGSTYNVGATMKLYDSNPSIILQRGTAIANADWHIQNNSGNLEISSGYDATTNNAFRSPSMFISYTGNVGIGTTSPVQLLDVSGNINIPLANSYRINNTLVMHNKGYSGNIFVGANAGYTDSTGNYNTAIGANALYYNKTGSAATAIGYNAMYNANNTSTAFTSYNTAIGYEALKGSDTPANNTGTFNTAIGFRTMYSNSSGHSNTSIGNMSLPENTSGDYNTATGGASLRYNTEGDENTANGQNALFHNTTGDYNTAVGSNALYSNITGYNNTVIGAWSGYNRATDTACTFIGYGADANGNYFNATAIGNGAIVDARNHIRIGNTSVTQIGGQVGWSTLSDNRFKFNIKDSVKGLEFIKKLHPVTYQVNTHKLDSFLIQNMPDSIKIMHQAGMNFATSTAKIHSGFIAQEVQQAAADCNFYSSIVNAPSNTSEPYSMSYSELVVPLVKAVQEQQKIIEQLIIENNLMKAKNIYFQNEINNIKTHVGM